MYILYAALLQTAAGSEIIFIREIVNLPFTIWPQIAAHLGCTSWYIKRIYDRKVLNEDMNYVSECAEFPDRCFIEVAVDWGQRIKETGSRPRNMKTVLDVCRKLCVGSAKELSKLASFEEKLISGIKWY